MIENNYSTPEQSEAPCATQEIFVTAQKILQILNDQDPENMTFNSLQGYAASLVEGLKKSNAEKIIAEQAAEILRLKSFIDKAWQFSFDQIGNPLAPSVFKKWKAANHLNPEQGVAPYQRIDEGLLRDINERIEEVYEQFLAKNFTGQVSPFPKELFFLYDLRYKIMRNNRHPRDWYQVGKLVVRVYDGTNCDCEMCNKSRTRGFVIDGHEQASYLFDLQNEAGYRYSEPYRLTGEEIQQYKPSFKNTEE
jgi:hypothetical protein